MGRTYAVSLDKIIKEFSLEPLFVPEDSEQILVTSADILRPGLQLGGFYEFFDHKRIQVLGKMETAFLERLSDEKRRISIKKFMETRPPAIILTRSLACFDDMLAYAHSINVPVLRTAEATSYFMSGLISYLNVELAPRATHHGVLVEVYGEGILLLGESGVGKSETAIELIKRGHRLIADDAVEIRKVSSKTLVGTAPENIRHYIELRGIGIINARRIFGMGAVKMTEKIDMIINLELWDASKEYDRVGASSEYTEILGIQTPSLCIPVKPGRNLAIIIEVAAMNNRQKKMGYNAAQELLQQLGLASSAESADSPDPF